MKMIFHNIEKQKVYTYGQLWVHMKKVETP